MTFNRFLCVLIAALWMQGAAASSGERAAAAVGERLRADDCAGAISRLNDGLQRGEPEVALLAGTMFEGGFCVERNWNKAVSFYATAAEGGVTEGALRLAAGFAAQANGPDSAAALWWARRAGLKLDRCMPSLPKTEDPDAFVAELRAWPVQELELCNYLAGLLSFIHAELHYPMKGVQRNIVGRLEVEFAPATNRFRSDPGGVHYTAAMGLGDTFSSAMSLGLARYKRPAGIDRSLTLFQVFLVDTDKANWW